MLTLLVQNNPDGTDCIPIPWQTGEIAGQPRYDLLAAATHEFGHTLEIGHSGDADNYPYSVMFADIDKGRSNQRQVYYYDQKCADQFGGAREARSLVKNHTSAGFGSGYLTSDSSWDMADSSVGNAWYQIGAFWYQGFAWSGRRSDYAIYSLHTNSSNTYAAYSGAGTESDGIGPVVDTLPEDPTAQFVFYSTGYDYPSNYVKADEHRLRRVRSTNHFSTKSDQAVMRCNQLALGQWNTCTTETYVLTGEPITLAYYDLDFGSHSPSGGMTVIGWVNQWRLQEGDEEHEINLVLGMIDDHTFAVPFRTGYYSNASPGIACKAGEAGAYDCVLVWADANDSLNRIRVDRFYAAEGTLGYEFHFEESPSTLLDSTATKIAAWWLHDRFWMAYRETAVGNPIQVNYSYDGSTWYYHSHPASTSITGPAVASTRSNSENRLMWTAP